MCLYEKVTNIIPEERVHQDVYFKELTTFRVGGKAGLLVEPASSRELADLLALLKEESKPFFIIGNGSNLLVSDEGLDVVVIRLSGDFLNIKVSDNKITAGAGVMVTKLANTAKEHELTGLEFSYGIPGTVGGAMVMNAGAYDGEMSFVVESVEMMDSDLNIRTYSKEEMKFSYRHSILKEEKYIVLSTTFKLAYGNRQEIENKMNDFMERRRSKQPLEYPSAGSTFKRPEGYFAGKLIQDAGLSGKRIGGACVSPKHCGFVVNDQNATARDVSDLMDLVTQEVKTQFGVTLEPEVIKLGSF